MIFMTQADTVENLGGIFTIKGQKFCRQESKKSSVCDVICTAREALVGLRL